MTEAVRKCARDSAVVTEAAAAGVVRSRACWALCETLYAQPSWQPRRGPQLFSPLYG